MRNLFILFIAAGFLLSCGGNTKDNEAAEKAKLDSIIKAEKQRTADSIANAQLTEEQNKQRIDDSINALNKKQKTGSGTKTGYTKKTNTAEEKKNLQIDKSGGIRFGQPGN